MAEENRAINNVPHKVCRVCRGYVPQAEIEHGICIDCQIEKQTLRKKKGYQNDDREHSGNNV